MNDNYEAMSDRQLTFQMMRHLPIAVVIGSEFEHGSAVMCHDNVSQYPFDPCNNWNDIMPIAVEHNISLNWYEDAVGIYCHASSRKDDDIGPYFYHDDESPQRAIAICFLKLKDAK